MEQSGKQAGVPGTFLQFLRMGIGGELRRLEGPSGADRHPVDHAPLAVHHIIERRARSLHTKVLVLARTAMFLVGLHKRQSVLVGADGKVMAFLGDVSPATHSHEILELVAKGTAEQRGTAPAPAAAP